MKNLHQISRAEDRSPFLFVEKSRVYVDGNNVRIVNKEYNISVNPNSISGLLLGLGTSITHSAVKTLTEYHVTIQWIASDMLHTYAHTFDSKQRTKNLLKQAALMANDNTRMLVVRKMYKLRFEEDVLEDSLFSIRGKEGARVRKAYENIAKEKGIEWNGRHYVPNHPEKSDLPNRLLSLANSYLYGLCLSVIIQLGYSPSIGFIHSGFALSFVYDVSDFYKTKFIIPIAFEIASLENAIHDLKLKNDIVKMFEKEKFTEKIENDIKHVMNVEYKQSIEKNGLWTP